MKTRNKGLLLSFVGVLILSPDSLFIRLVNLDDFSLIFYRSALPIVTILIFLIYTYKRSFLKFVGIYLASNTFIFLFNFLK